MNKEYKCVDVKIKAKEGNLIDALYDKSRQLIFINWMTVEFIEHLGYEIMESEEEE